MDESYLKVICISNEILRNHGILPPRPKTPPTPSPPGSPTFDDLINESTLPELAKLNDTLSNDAHIQRVEHERRKREQEERRIKRDARFGEIIPISREDYTREVTEASAKDAEDDDNERGTGVVCFLYKDGYVSALILPLLPPLPPLPASPYKELSETDAAQDCRVRPRKEFPRKPKRQIPQHQICLDSRG